MPPKKGKKISLNEFLGDNTLGSWADEMDNLPSAPSGRTDDDQGRPGARRDDFLSTRPDRSAMGPPREDLPLPTQPPYTAFVGNLAFDLAESELEDFFASCKPKNAKIIKDRDEKPKGFGYVELEDLDGLKTALEMSGANFSGRTIRVSVAEPPKERAGFGGGFDEGKFDNPWRRDGPLPDLPGRDREAPRRRFDGPDERMPSVAEGPSDWRSAMPSRPQGQPADDGFKRRKDPAFESSGAADREDSWTMGAKFRAGPPPVEEGSRFGGRGRGDMGPPRAPVQEESDWRTAKRPERGSTSPTTSTPPTPQMRRKLELLPRSGSASGTSSPLASPKIGPTPSASIPASRSNPFGAAKPVDVTSREAEVVEKLEKEKDRFTSMSRTSSRTASERPPISRTNTPPTAAPSSPRPAQARPAPVRPTLSFANAAAKKGEEKDGGDVEAVSTQLAEVEV